MRYVPVGAIRENMVLAKNIYSEKGQLLLNKGCKILNNYLDSIISMGFPGVYIQDTLSEDIEIESIIRNELRSKTVEGVKDFFISVEKNKRHYKEFKKRIEITLEKILNDDDLMINMKDLKTFDEYTYKHSVNVTVLSMIIGTSLKLSYKEMFNLGRAALLHDIGKMFVSKEILNKPGKLDTSEMEIMKNHSQFGYKYLKKRYGFSTLTYNGVLDHHEKYDGTGYPNNRVGKEISLFGRIIAIADVYDALTSDRPYRKAALPSDVIEFIMGGPGTHFDFELVNIFIKKVAAYPIGTCVKLNNGLVGIVVENFPDSCTRPKIRLLDCDNKEYNYINLRDDIGSENLTIIDIVNI